MLVLMSRNHVIYLLLKNDGFITSIVFLKLNANIDISTWIIHLQKKKKYI
jgi:hypothetical protein